MYAAGKTVKRPPQTLPRVFERMTMVVMMEPPMNDLISVCCIVIGTGSILVS